VSLFVVRKVAVILVIVVVVVAVAVVVVVVVVVAAHLVRNAHVLGHTIETE
jgi:hypothetical protein